MRDLTQFVFLAPTADGRRVAEGTAQIAAALRQMDGTASELTDILNARGGSFDADEIMRTAPAEVPRKPKTTYTAPAATSSRGSPRPSVRAQPKAAASAQPPLLAELRGMRLMALQRRAVDEGVDSDKVDDAMESDDPKATLISLLVEASSGGGQEREDTQLRAELEGMRLMDLYRRASNDSALDADKVEQAMEDDDPKATLIALLTQQSSTSRAVEGALERAAAAKAEALQALRAELSGMRLMALQRRAVAEGVDADEVDDAMESADPKASLVALVLRHAA
eukprot:COSAG04_NODE_418_length_14698_cov_5.217412_4_plen_282_part_00